MYDFSKNLLPLLEELLSFIHLETDESLKQSELSIGVIQTSLKKLKSFIIRYKFKNHLEEIKFFKEVKPRFFSKLIYHITVYNIEKYRPAGSDKSKRKYLQGELDNIEQYFNQNLDFIKYYRTQKTYIDHKYFLRGEHELSLTIDSFFFETDPKFSTSHDFKVSKVIANELLEIYLKGEIEAIDKKETLPYKPFTSPKVKLTWTTSKASLVEVIYALQSIGAFNHTNASIKDIVNYFENVFNIDLSHFYTTFQEIKERKGSQTMFLKSLQDALQKRIDEKDNRF